jgi:ribosomal protein S11
MGIRGRTKLKQLKKLKKLEKLERLKKLKELKKDPYVFTYLSKNNEISFIKKSKKKKILFLKKAYTYTLKKKITNSLISKSKFLKKIDIKIVQNNIFCTLSDLKQNKTLHTSSTGAYKIKVSKRKLKYFYKTFLYIFFEKIKKKYKITNNTIFNVTAPIKIRKKICKLLKKKLKRKKKKTPNIVINIVSKKCFNGCKAKKKLRKKRRLYRIYK